MTTLNSWFEPENYKKAALGCFGKAIIWFFILMAVLALVVIITPFLGGKSGQSICPHCGKSIKIEKGE